MTQIALRMVVVRRPNSTKTMPLPAHHHRLLRLLAILIVVASTIRTSYIVQAQQSAAGQDTLIGIVGRDFVMMGADSCTSGGGGIALTSMNVDKIVTIHDGWTPVKSRMKRLGYFPTNGSASNDEGNRRCYDDYARASSEQQAIAVGFAGDAADADRLVGILKTHVQIREYEAGIGNDVTCVFDGRTGVLTRMMSAAIPVATGMDSEAIAYLSRNEISSRMRTRQPLQLCLLVGGMVRCISNSHSEGVLANPNTNVMGRIQKQILAGSAAYRPMNIGLSEQIIHIDGSDVGSSSTMSQSPILNMGDYRALSNPFLAPKLFWLDQYGSLQNMRYAAHGYGSNFAYSILDQRYQGGMSRQEAVELIRDCFEQLRQRYVINSPKPPRIKCIDEYGVTEVIDS